mmetsp:Transcript_22188/g.44592  ORF Transcript_22188/g.44592 Transcript_22188/m.44592 type:complete len:1018 (-) Transcript_22188:1828-4881(-)
MQQPSLHDRPKQPHCCCRHRPMIRGRRRASFTSCAITIFAVATLSSAAVSILVSPHGNSILASAATPASSVTSVSPYSTVESSTFIFSLLKRRKQRRLDKQQKSTSLLEEGRGTGGLIMEEKINHAGSANGKTLPIVNNGRRYPHDIPGNLPPRSLAEFDFVNDEPYATDVHPIDNAYDRLSQTLEQVDNNTTTTRSQDINSPSLDSMEGCDDDTITYTRGSNQLQEKLLETTADILSTSPQTPEAPSSKETLAATSDSSISEVDDTTTSWAKRNARSIDEGIRFKFQLRQGLEEQTKIHREQLLSDLMQGVMRGTNSALDAEPDVTIMKRNVTNPIRSWLSGRFGKKDNGVAAAVKDDGGGQPPEESEASIQAALTTTTVDKSNKREFFSRTITGLLMALAEEADGLEVDVDVDDNTPFWNKTFNSINVKFARLGFRQMRLGGLDNALTELEAALAPSEKFSFAMGLFKAGGKVTTADEAFDKIDVDNSGSLDEEELAQALKMAAILGGNTFGARSKEVVADMASKLIRLYDSNGDGVVDREEYRVMVKDMSALRDARLSEEYHQQPSEPETRRRSWFRRRRSGASNSDNMDDVPLSDDESIIDITDDKDFWESMEHGEGSIVFKDMKLDLRRLLFGLIPGMKKILPGGPLILQPFTATVTASWNREDILNSVLIDIGLRRLVARALGRRVRGIRDLFDGAVFYGRTWKNLEQNAPQIEVLKLEDVQFDWKDRLIITGRAKIKTSPDAPAIENGFRLRTKIGTRGNGRIIGLLQPEIAIFAELPRDFMNDMRTKCKEMFDYTLPRYEPLYTYIPLVSPLKKNDKMDGFNMGEDNQLKSIEIKNGKLCFEFSAVLRPGRFLGNHYMAFTVPNRTLILTLDRVKEAMRNARKNKRLAERAAREVQQLAEADSTYNAILTEEYSTGRVTSLSPEGKLRIRRLESELKATIQDELVMREIEDSAKEAGKSFISKFVEGYSGAIRQELDLEMNARLSSSISSFFGSQESIGDGDDSTETSS